MTSNVHTYEFVALGHQSRLASAEHARAVRAARASTKPRAPRAWLRLPRVRFRAPYAVQARVASGQI